jgi:mRNA interferase RelE/StbE
MKYILRYTEHAVDDLKILDKKFAQRIVTKLDWFVVQENPMKFSKKLQDFTYGSYRFRIGDYRVLFDLEESTGKIIILMILRVKHRKDVYNI